MMDKYGHILKSNWIVMLKFKVGTRVMSRYNNRSLGIVIAYSSRKDIRVLWESGYYLYHISWDLKVYAN